MCVHKGLFLSTQPEKQQAGFVIHNPECCVLVVSLRGDDLVLALNWPRVQSLSFQLGQKVSILSYGGGMAWCFPPRTMEQAVRGSPGDLRDAPSCPVSSCPHAATSALGNSGSLGTCVAAVLHWGSGWQWLGEQLQKHPKASSPFSSHRFLSWPWNWFRSF